MTTGNHAKSSDKRARLHPPETNSMTESAPGKWQIVQAKRNKPSGEVKKNNKVSFEVWKIKLEIPRQEYHQMSGGKKNQNQPLPF